MRTFLLLLFLLPFAVIAQVSTYYSGDVSANFGRQLSWTGVGANLSGNIRVVNNLYAGVSTGVLHIRPYVNHLTIPLSARVTFFTSNEEKFAPFGLFEYGKLFYKEKGFAGIQDYVMEGKHSFFTGVGVRLPSHHKTYPFFAIGYAGFFYANNQYDHQNTLLVSRPYTFRRIAIRAGIMLPRKSHH
ncbi:MAG TPA: hypothetical protein VMR70_10845 [Flavisolibacter sp.]|nr:hypothetical protein [Flavisolibacter sp.]